MPVLQKPGVTETAPPPTYTRFICIFTCFSLLPSAGLYRNDLLQQFLESWYNQKFLGTHCTFGDDRHLTNRMLSIGYATK